MKAILVVAHDAGGAEVISAWVRRHPHFSYSFILEGPAENIFKKKLGDIPCHSFKDLIPLTLQTEIILTGTSWVSDLEKEAILCGKAKHKKTITYLDHWCDYPERFQYKNAQVLPDEFWVGDEYAFEIAKHHFSPLPITLVENCYFDDLKSEFALLKSSTRPSDKLRLLYICEPIADYAKKQFGRRDYFNYTEFEALLFFLNRIARADYCSLIETVKIRLHPSEAKGKYHSILCQNWPYLLVESESNLLEDMQWTDWVVGCSSMVLVQSVLANKQVFTCIPHTARVFKLPLPQIQELPDAIESVRQKISLECK